MTRVTFVPFDQDREDQKVEDAAERRAMRTAPIESEDDDWVLRFGGLDPEDPEFNDVETFIEDMMDDDRSHFTHNELACLNANTGVPVHAIRTALEGYGFKLKPRLLVRETRGFKSNPNTRWSSCPTHGGGGGGCIMGMADPG